MTREEAINEWTFRRDHIKTCLDEYGEEPSLRHYVELIDMAIEALQTAEINCVHCPRYYETEEDDGVKGHCSADRPSGDLISREDAIKAVEQEYKIDRGYMVDDYTYGFNQAIQYVSDIILQDLPSAEAVQGKWVRCEEEIKDLEGNILCHVYWYECDQCGSRPPKDQWKNEWHSNFCPNCGARMKGGAE